MATRTRSVLVAVFDDRMEAERAVDDLEQIGFSHHDIGFALRGSDVTHGGMVTDAVGTKDERGAVTGAVTGGVVGGLLGAAAALIVPGVGPVLAAGVLATSLGYAGAGVAIGGILGAMTGAGLSEEEARYYEKQFHAGKALVTVDPRGRNAEVTAILRKHGGYDMHTCPENNVKDNDDIDCGGVALPR
jgi:hypothetical protein